jgi:hypothetical protein
MRRIDARISSIEGSWARCSAAVASDMDAWVELPALMIPVLSLTRVDPRMIAVDQRQPPRRLTR